MNHTIRVSEFTSRMFLRHIPQGRKFRENPATVFHPDGSVEFPVGADTMARLNRFRRGGETMEQTILRLFREHDRFRARGGA